MRIHHFQFPILQRISVDDIFWLGGGFKLFFRPTWGDDPICLKPPTSWHDITTVLCIVWIWCSRHLSICSRIECFLMLHVCIQLYIHSCFVWLITRIQDICFVWWSPGYQRLWTMNFWCIPVVVLKSRPALHVSHLIQKGIEYIYPYNYIQIYTINQYYIRIYIMH